jgi:hypothetical protein
MANYKLKPGNAGVITVVYQNQVHKIEIEPKITQANLEILFKAGVTNQHGSLIVEKLPDGQK